MPKRTINRNVMLLNIPEFRDSSVGYPLEFEAMHIRLLMTMWQNDGQIPSDDEDYLRRVSGGTPAQWTKHRQALAELFYLTPGHWNHTRVRASHAAAKALLNKMACAQ